MRILLIAVVVLLLGCSRGGQPSPPAQPDLKIANSSNPGERLEIESVLVKDKTTLCEFYSEQCPPCREMVPILERLAQMKPELAIRRINIDRPGSRGIDFDSPLAEQHDIHSVPAFRIYDGSGKLTAQGREARDQVRDWYQQGQLVERAGQSDISKNYEQAR